jgi:hypothetical protein
MNTGTALVVRSDLGFFLTSLLAIWLALCAKCVKRICANIAHGLHVRWHTERPSKPSDPTEETPLISRRTDDIAKAKDKKHANAAALIYKNAGGVRDVYQELIYELLPTGTPLIGRKEKTLTWGYWNMLLVFTLVFSIFAGGIIVGGLYIARVRNSGPALLDSKQAGLWLPSDGQSRDMQTRAFVRKLEKEIRAGDYASNCYGPTTNAFDAVRCDQLYRRRLQTNKYRLQTWQCPFQSPICAAENPVVFETSLIDAGDLGINRKNGPRFKRKTTCTLLNMSEPYITNHTGSDGTTRYYYNYGRKPTHEPPVDYTYNTTGDPFDLPSPVYEVA